MADELGSTAPSGLSRALGVRGATTPFLLGAAGAAAFVGSLVLDWENATLSGLSGVDPGFSSGVSGTVTVGVPQNNLGLVYLVGTLALIVALGAVLTRPATALRMRLAVSGLGVGLLGVVLSARAGSLVRGGIRRSGRRGIRCGGRTAVSGHRPAAAATGRAARLPSRPHGPGRLCRRPHRHLGHIDRPRDESRYPAGLRHIPVRSYTPAGRLDIRD
jgi:hypothetical protein